MIYNLNKKVLLVRAYFLYAYVLVFLSENRSNNIIFI